MLGDVAIQCCRTESTRPRAHAAGSRLDAVRADLDSELDVGITVRLCIALKDGLTGRALLLHRLGLEHDFVEDRGDIDQLGDIKLADANDIRAAHEGQLVAIRKPSVVPSIEAQAGVAHELVLEVSHRVLLVDGLGFGWQGLVASTPGHFEFLGRSDIWERC